MVNASQLYSQYMGVGAQVAWLTGALAEAVNEGRVMVISFYERADHDGCKGKWTRSKTELAARAATLGRTTSIRNRTGDPLATFGYTVMPDSARLASI